MLTDEGILNDITYIYQQNLNNNNNSNNPQSEIFEQNDINIFKTYSYTRGGNC